MSESFVADCGACSLCCTLLAIPDLLKPARMMCEHTTIHGGCAVQAYKATDSKLAACAQFECVWLGSQHDEGRWPRHLRPDLCHVVFGPKDRDDDHLIYVQVDPEHPSAWTAPLVREALDATIARGFRVEVIIDEIRFEYQSS